MALVLADRVRETTTTAGTGTITLLGAVSSCQSFAAVGDGNTTYYTIVAQSGTEWEVGIGTYTSSGTTLSRDTVLSSSNSGSLVNFSAGTKDVFVDYPASKAVYENAAGNVDGYPITGGTINNTTIGATTPSTGVFTTLTATGQTSLGGATGSESFRAIPVASAVNFLEARGGVAGNTNFPRLLTEGADANIWMTLVAKGATGIRNFVNGAEQFRVASTASAVNYVQVTGAATTAFPIISSQGSDSAVSLGLTAKGGNAIIFFTNSGSNRGLRVSHTASSVNYVDVFGGATGSVPVIGNAGSDSNIGLALKTTGTGAIDLAAGSRGVNISNGGTVTAITRTAAGTNYTSAPSVAITAPTTAGGVQATASATISVNVSTPTITSGGTGYTAGDTLTFSGGTSTVACQLTVSSVSGGVITGVTVVNSGIYTVAPSNPISVTGGTGSGATFTSVWGVTSTISITNAGSGYVEQPTVTFSGGGGSGAAAYATVGSTTTFRSIGHSGTVAMRFDVPSSLTNNVPTFRLIDSGNAQDSGVQVLGGIGGSVMNAFGAANATLSLHASGTGFIRLGSGGTSQTEQLRVSHTASAVNYVQVTGAATGGQPTISTQGSDANINLVLNAKGSSSVLLQTAGQNVFQATGSGAVANRLLITGTASGVAPSVSCVGSDTNIPLVLQPKGTGALQAQATTSTATGGNARGVNAVDWQTSRSAATAVASGSYSVVGGGSGNTASGFNASVVGGASNVASNNYAFVGGGLSNNAAFGMSGIVAGYSNQALGYLNLIAGGYANSGTSASTVTTQSATMNGTTAVTLSGSNANIKVGQLIIGTSINSFPYTYVAAISGTSLTLSQAASGSSTSTLSFYTPHGVVVGGGNNQATGAYSFIGGGGDAGTAANRNVASGDWSTVAGGMKNTASANHTSISGGYGNTASGIAAFVGGGGLYGDFGTGATAPNTASGVSSAVLGGWNNSATSNGAAVLGGVESQATGFYSAVVGGSYGTTRGVIGNTVFPAANNPIGTRGAAQAALLILGTQTTDATATVLRSNTSAAGTTNQVILPNNSAYYFKGTVIANVTGGGNTKGWTIEGAIKRGANAASTALVGTPTVTSLYADAGASTWAITATADTTNGGLAITFTGQAGTTIRVVCKVETTEVTF